MSIQISDEDVADIARNFIIACVWADCDEGTNPRATRTAQAAAELIVREFYKANEALCVEALACQDYGWHNGQRDACAQFGHDLYLTSQGHGAGFWDRDALPNGLRAKLSGACDMVIHRGEPWTYDYEFYRGWLYIRTR